MSALHTLKDVLVSYLLTVPVLCVTIITSLLGGLFSEVFLKRAIVVLLGHIVNRTKTNVDNELLHQAKKAWGLEDIPDEEPNNG